MHRSHITQKLARARINDQLARAEAYRLAAAAIRAQSPGPAARERGSPRPCARCSPAPWPAALRRDPSDVRPGYPLTTKKG